MNHPCLEPAGAEFRLAGIDPDETFGMTRDEAERRYLDLQSRLNKLQEKFRADGSRAILIVLQAMDTGGKDGTIKKLVDSVDPQGVEIENFKAPSSLELAHDFLWRIHHRVPRKGQIAIFNRSHYEDVLIVRVQDLAPRAVWKARYHQIREFEHLLVASGTVVLKFFLHISKDEQRQRLEERLADPHKHWKFDAGDLTQRARWDDYMEAYEDAIRKCSTPEGPWFVIPANKKWYRNWAVTEVLVERLESMDLKYPTPDLSGVRVPE